jgi:hypothetical protein
MGPPSGTQDLAVVVGDLAMGPPDLVPPPPPPSRDLAVYDLTGLVNCFGVATCDPQAMFCIRYFKGSQASPGMMSAAPACYAPSDTCQDQGQPMNCGCIQVDATLGLGCEGSCLDRGDGTYDCFAQ